MKTLLLLRHAKTEKEAPRGDEKRALTKRGERDAATIARRIDAISGCPDIIVTSPAVRARQTAAIVAEHLQFTGPVVARRSIYGADTDTLLRVVHRLSREAGCVLLVGHNPGFEELGVALAATTEPDFHLPTSGLMRLEFDVSRWGEVRPGEGRLLGVYSPKTIEHP